MPSSLRCFMAIATPTACGICVPSGDEIDEYLAPPDWDASLTELEERRVEKNSASGDGARGRASSSSSSSFGKRGVALDDEGE